eukprot:Awhi_evm1s9412
MSDQYLLLFRAQDGYIFKVLTELLQVNVKSMCFHGRWMTQHSCSTTPQILAKDTLHGYLMKYGAYDTDPYTRTNQLDAQHPQHKTKSSDRAIECMILRVTHDSTDDEYII